jgi:hypothetical protein
MTTKTTTRLRLTLVERWQLHARRYHSAAIGIACIVVLLLARQMLNGAAPATAVPPTPGLVILIATSPAVVPPTAVPAAAQVAAVLPRFVVCYDQPISGAVLGPIPAPDASAVVARYGAAWVMTPWNGGYCWLRAADVGLPNVADLEPAPQPQIVERPIYVSAPEMAVAMPEIYAVTSEPPAVPTLAPQQMVILDRQRWALDAQHTVGR